MGFLRLQSGIWSPKLQNEVLYRGIKECNNSFHYKQRKLEVILYSFTIKVVFKTKPPILFIYFVTIMKYFLSTMPKNFKCLKLNTK